MLLYIDISKYINTSHITYMNVEQVIDPKEEYNGEKNTITKYYMYAVAFHMTDGFKYMSKLFTKKYDAELWLRQLITEIPKNEQS